MLRIPCAAGDELGPFGVDAPEASVACIAIEALPPSSAEGSQQYVAQLQRQLILAHYECGQLQEVRVRK